MPGGASSETRQVSQEGYTNPVMKQVFSRATHARVPLQQTSCAADSLQVRLPQADAQEEGAVGAPTDGLELHQGITRRVDVCEVAIAARSAVGRRDDTPARLGRVRWPGAFAARHFWVAVGTCAARAGVDAGELDG